MAASKGANRFASLFKSFSFPREKARDAAALIGGVALGGLLVILARILEEGVGVQPSTERIELGLFLAVLGISFGYHLGLSLSRKDRTFYLFASFLGTIALDAMLRQSRESYISWVFVLATAFSVALWLSDLIVRIRGQFIHIFCTELSWYAFELHVTYVYLVPLLNIFLSQIRSGRLEPDVLMAFAFLAFGLVGFAIFIRYVTAKKTRFAKL